MYRIVVANSMPRNSLPDQLQLPDARRGFDPIAAELSKFNVIAGDNTAGRSANAAALSVTNPSGAIRSFRYTVILRAQALDKRSSLEAAWLQLLALAEHSCERMIQKLYIDGTSGISV